jgi:hypothetical protein
MESDDLYSILLLVFFVSIIIAMYFSDNRNGRRR